MGKLQGTVRESASDNVVELVLAEGACTAPDEKAANPPTYDEMLANGAAWIKQAYTAAAARCAEQFRRQTLALP